MNMNVQYLSPSELKPYENNPRYNESAVQTVKNSIEAFGFKNPIVVDKDLVVINGHTRLKASIELGLEQVPVIIASDLTEEQTKAFRIMDNKSSELAEWDYEKLFKELNTLDTNDFPIDLTGFDALSLEQLRMELDEDFGVSDDEDEEYQEDDEIEDDETESDEAEEKNYIIQYNIIFNNEEEQAVWHNYLRHLKDKYPNEQTISARIVKDIAENVGNSHE